MVPLFRLLLILSLGTTAANADEKKPAAPAEKAAMEFLTAALFERDVEKAVSFVDADAERKSYGKGSLIRDLREEIPDLPPPSGLEIREIHFFRKADVKELSERFDPKFGLGRIAERIDDGLGCLVVAKVKSPDGKVKTAYLAWVFQSIDGQYTVAYQDDD